MNAIKQILIAEDQTDIRDLLALNLRGEAFEKFVKESVDEIQDLSKKIGIVK